MSRPTGAEVIDDGTDKVLGVTPLELHQRRQSHVIDLRLEKTGFAASHLSIPGDQDFEEEIALKAQSRPATKRALAPPRGPRGGPNAVKETATPPGGTPAPAQAPPTAPTPTEAPKPRTKVEKW